MQGYCPECERRNRSDLAKYGFSLHDGYNYWTIIKEVRSCCAIKVQLESHDATSVTVSYNGNLYTKDRGEFMKSSWRDIDSF